MKRTVFLLALLLAVGPAAAETDLVSADYVLGMLEAGMDQDDIIEHVIDNDLMFHLEQGDIDRLREAGAGKDLLRVVTRREFVGDEGYGWAAPYSGYPYYYPGYVVAPWFYGYYSYYYPRYTYHVYPYYAYPRYDRRYSITPRGGTRPPVVPRGSWSPGPSTGRGQGRRAPRGSH